MPAARGVPSVELTTPNTNCDHVLTTLYKTSNVLRAVKYRYQPPSFTASGGPALSTFLRYDYFSLQQQHRSTGTLN